MESYDVGSGFPFLLKERREEINLLFFFLFIIRRL
jgi:hypothetical protein